MPDVVYISSNSLKTTNHEKDLGETEKALQRGSLSIKNEQEGLPWWCSGWESACRCRGHGFEPWSGRIPHAAEQLGP